MTSHWRRCALDGGIVCGLWLSSTLLLRFVEGLVAVALVLALLPLRTRGAPRQERVAQVAFELWLVPGLVVAGVCALASVAGTTRLLVALPPIVAWAICIPLGARHCRRRRGGGLGARGSLWGAIATSVLLAALLGALMFRDRTRLPIESVDEYLAALDAAGAGTVLAPAENPCSHRDDLPTCRFVVGTGVCVGVEPTVIDTSGWFWSHLGDSPGSSVLPHPSRICPDIRVSRDARTGHAAAQLRDDFPSDEHGWVSGRRTGPSRFIVGAQPASRWGEALGFLAEMRAPSWWKWLGGACLLVAVSTLAAVLLRKREERSVPLSDPYRPDPDPPRQPTITFLACRYSLTISIVAIAPLLVAMAMGHRQIVPSFGLPIAVAVAPTPDQAGGAARKNAVLYIHADEKGCTGSGVVLDQLYIGRAPRWGVTVEPGRHRIEVCGAAETVSLAPGEVREIATIR